MSTTAKATPPMEMARRAFSFRRFLRASVHMEVPSRGWCDVRAIIAASPRSSERIVGARPFQIAQRTGYSVSLVSAAAPSQRESPRAPFAARFESIGATLPEQRLSTKDLMARVKTRGRVDLEGLTGIRERRVCAEGEDSYTLSVDAAKECLRYSAHEAADLEMIICCSISKFKDGLNFVYEPPLSLYVKEAIGAKKALAFDIANACAGMLTGVFIMNDFVRRGIITRGMVISGEYITSLSENAVAAREDRPQRAVAVAQPR